MKVLANPGFDFHALLLADLGAIPGLPVAVI